MFWTFYHNCSGLQVSLVQECQSTDPYSIIGPTNTQTKSFRKAHNVINCIHMKVIRFRKPNICTPLQQDFSI